MKQTILILFLFMFFLFNSQISILYSQPVQQWVRYYPEQNIFQGTSFAMVLDNLNNVYIAGGVDNVPPNGNVGFCTIKYSPSGTQQWVANYFGNNTGGREAFAIAIDSSKNVYVTGDSYENGDYFDYCTIKYDSNGVQQWIRFYDDTLHGIDEAQKIGVDKAGNIYLSGISQISSGNYSFTTIKYSTDGRLIWINAVNIGPGGPGADGVAGLVIDDSCNIYITGWGGGPRTLKYDSTGNLKWNNLFFGGGESHSIDIDKFHNIYISGFTYGGSDRRDFITVKYTSSGAQLWVKQFNADSLAYPSYYVSNSIAVDSTGNIFVGGYSDLGVGMKFCVIKYTNDGNLIWFNKDTSRIDGAETYMTIDNKSNIYLTSNNYWSIFDYNYFPIILKYDSSGNFIWKYRDSTSDFPLYIAIDNNYDIFTTGSRDARMCTVKYSQLTGIKKILSNNPTEFTLYQNFPNPFNPTTKIKFDIPFSREMSVGMSILTQLKIFDIAGRVVATLVNEHLKTGTYEFEWNATKIASGIYFYQLLTTDFIQTKKMIVLK